MNTYMYIELVNTSLYVFIYKIWLVGAAPVRYVLISFWHYFGCRDLTLVLQASFSLLNILNVTHMVCVKSNETACV